jgi:hypothetical protein
MEYRDQIFENEDVLLDGNTFTGCTFRNCNLLFNAIAPGRFSANRVYNCPYVFGGPADLMLQFLSAIFNGGGEGGQRIIENLFDQVRSGWPPNHAGPA